MGISGEAGFKGKGGHDFVVRRTLGILKGSKIIRKDMVVWMCV